MTSVGEMVSRSRTLYSQYARRTVAPAAAEQSSQTTRFPPVISDGFTSATSAFSKLPMPATLTLRAFSNGPLLGGLEWAHSAETRWVSMRARKHRFTLLRLAGDSSVSRRSSSLWKNSVVSFWSSMALCMPISLHDVIMSTLSKLLSSLWSMKCIVRRSCRSTSPRGTRAAGLSGRLPVPHTLHVSASQPLRIVHTGQPHVAESSCSSAGGVPSLALQIQSRNSSISWKNWSIEFM